MDTKKIEGLIVMLREKTVSNKVNWQKTTRVGSYLATFPGYSITISTRQRQQENDVDYIISIFDADGVLVESTDDVVLKQQNDKFNAYVVLGEIYDVARRKALGVDKAIDKILSELEKT
jgi:hypothetical protein